MYLINLISVMQKKKKNTAMSMQKQTGHHAKKKQIKENFIQNAVCFIIYIIINNYFLK